MEGPLLFGFLAYGLISLLTFCLWIFFMAFGKIAYKIGDFPKKPKPLRSKNAPKSFQCIWGAYLPSRAVCPC
jgi:hypothetical protein